MICEKDLWLLSKKTKTLALPANLSLTRESTDCKSQEEKEPFPVTHRENRSLATTSAGGSYQMSGAAKTKAARRKPSLKHQKAPSQSNERGVYGAGL